MKLDAIDFPGSSVTASIDAIYALIPDVECQGLCQDACGPVLMSEAEERRIIKRTGRPVTADPVTLQCERLSVFGRCTIYANRPAICRLFGVADGLPCPWGCKPKAPLNETDAADIFRALESLRGTAV